MDPGLRRDDMKGWFASDLKLLHYSCMQVYLPIAEMAVPVETILGVSAVVGFLSAIFGIGGGFLTTRNARSWWHPASPACWGTGTRVMSM
jgi:hypothetical protein